MYAAEEALRQAEALGVTGRPVLEVRVERALDVGRAHDVRAGRWRVDFGDGLAAACVWAGLTDGTHGGWVAQRWRVLEVFGTGSRSR